MQDVLYNTSSEEFSLCHLQKYQQFIHLGDNISDLEEQFREGEVCQNTLEAKRERSWEPGFSWQSQVDATTMMHDKEAQRERRRVQRTQCSFQVIIHHQWLCLLLFMPTGDGASSIKHFLGVTNWKTHWRIVFTLHKK